MTTLQIVGNSSYGGASYLILKWCKYLVQQGCGVDVLATDSYFCEKLFEIPGIHVIENIFIPRNIELLQDFKAFRKLSKLISKRNYDIVHTYTATPGFLGRIAAKFVGVPVIFHHQAGWTVTEYSSISERLIYTPLEFIAVLASTKSICVSRAVASQAKQHHIAPQSKLITICNGIDPQPFINSATNGFKDSLRCELGLTTDHLLIGNSGRLSPQKDNASLIKAMIPLKTLLGDRLFSLLLAGDGSDRYELENLAESLKIKKQVFFLGFYKDIPKFLAELDIFVNPSLWEGLSISLLEAMAAAKPIITTSILPNAELIDHEATGLLVSPKSPAQIAKAIARFVQEPELAKKCAFNARRRLLKRYTIDRMFQETWELYCSLMRNS